MPYESQTKTNTEVLSSAEIRELNDDDTYEKMADKFLSVEKYEHALSCYTLAIVSEQNESTPFEKKNKSLYYQIA